MTAARVHIIIQLICLEVFTLWGCGVVAVLQLAAGVFYGISRREIRLLIAGRQVISGDRLQQLHLK